MQLSVVHITQVNLEKNNELFVGTNETVHYTGLLIFHVVADPRNSLKNAKYREIRQKYFQIHVGKAYLILILAIRPALFTPNPKFILKLRHCNE